MKYLYAVLILAPLSGALWLFLARLKKTPHIVIDTIMGIKLQMSRSSGIVETVILPAERISAGFSPAFDIDLSCYTKPGRSSGKTPVEELTLQLADGRLAVTARSKVMLNGVERSSGSIPIDGSLLFKNCRITFLGPVEVKKERSVYPDTKSLRIHAAAPVSATLATMILLVMSLIDLAKSSYFQKPEPRPALITEYHEREMPLPEAVPDQTRAEVQEPSPLPESQPLPSLYPAPRVIKPGDPVPDEKVDVVFIHAHPDDESLDYGTLMALCSETGLKTATVLLTDGEGGIFQQDYAGSQNNIAYTRVQEAGRAMQHLGSSLYFRLGLKNNPYNGVLDEKSVEEVLQLWDSTAVVKRLAEIITALGPTVVVSPEGPSHAREHFEHETTGLLARMALDKLRLDGGHLPDAHLVPIDPRQKDAYMGLVAFPRITVLERQKQALLSHATQADASYFGVRMIEQYHEEYYLIQYWDMAVPFMQYFGLDTAFNTYRQVP